MGDPIEDIRLATIDARFGSLSCLLNAVSGLLINHTTAQIVEVVTQCSNYSMNVLADALAVLTLSQHRQEVRSHFETVPLQPVQEILGDLLLSHPSPHVRGAIAAPLCCVCCRPQLLSELLTLLMDTDFTVHCAAARAFSASQWSMKEDGYLSYLHRDEAQKARLSASLCPPEQQGSSDADGAHEPIVSEVGLRVVEALAVGYVTTCGWWLEHIIHGVLYFLPELLLRTMTCGDVLLELNAVEVLCGLLKLNSETKKRLPSPHEEPSSMNGRNENARTLSVRPHVPTHTTEGDLADVFLHKARQPFLEAIEYLLDQPPGHVLKCFAFRSVSQLTRAFRETGDAAVIKDFLAMSQEKGWLDRILEEGWQSGSDDTQNLTAVSLEVLIQMLEATIEASATGTRQETVRDFLVPHCDILRALWRRDVCNSQEKIGSVFDHRVMATLSAFAHLITITGRLGWDTLFEGSSGGDPQQWHEALRQTLLLRGNPEVRCAMLDFMAVLMKTGDPPLISYSIWKVHLLHDADMMEYLTYPRKELDEQCIQARRRVVLGLRDAARICEASPNPWEYVAETLSSKVGVKALSHHIALGE